MRGIRSHTLFSFLTLFFFHPLVPVIAVTINIASKNGNSFDVNWSLQPSDPKDFYLLAVPWPGKEEDVRKKQPPSRDEIHNQLVKNGNAEEMFARKTDIKANGRNAGRNTVNSPKDGLVLVVAAKGADTKAQLLGEQWVTLGTQTQPPPQPPQNPLPTQSQSPPPSASSDGGTPNTDTANPANPSPTPSPTGTGDGGQNTDPSNSHSSPLGSHSTVITFIAGVGTTTLSFATGVGGSINTNHPDAAISTDVPPSSDPTNPDQSQNLSSSKRNNLPLILGLAITLPLLLTALLFVFFWLPRKRKMERRRRHLEQSAAYASNMVGPGAPYTFGPGEARESAQSVFGRHFRKGRDGRPKERGFNPAMMVARAWSVSSRSSAPSLASDSGGQHDEKAEWQGRNGAGIANPRY